MGSIVRVPNIQPVQTAQRIVSMALEGSSSPEVIQLSKYFTRNLRDARESPYLAKLSEIQAVYNWVNEKIRYVHDPEHIELVYSAPAMLQRVKKFGRWAEDCDSYSLLIMSLLMALGHRTRITIAGFNDTMPDVYTHVFAEALLPPIGDHPAQWVIIDPTAGKRVHEMAKKYQNIKEFLPMTEVAPSWIVQALIGPDESQQDAALQYAHKLPPEQKQAFLKIANYYKPYLRRNLQQRIATLTFDNRNQGSLSGFLGACASCSSGGSGMHSYGSLFGHAMGALGQDNDWGQDNGD